MQALVGALMLALFCSVGEGCTPMLRDPRWYITRLRGALPSRSAIQDRVTDTFSRTSLSEAYSVILPTSPDPLICRTTNDDVFEEGACLRVATCMYFGGISYGSCGGGIGSCCIFEKRCGETTEAYMTYFTNPRHPMPTAGFGECKLTVSPMHESICQYRVDFDKLSMTGPDKSSDCVTDTVAVTGGSPVPRMCGELTGQHFYVDTKPSSGPIELSIDTARGGPQTRNWMIRVTQIPCNSPKRVPSGCLQYYEGTSGTVTSFNFIEDLPKEGTTKQLKNQKYGICVNSVVGYCELTWSASVGRYSFSMEGDTSQEDAKFMSKHGIGNCTSDYVTIPGGIYTDTQGNSAEAERYCGSKFPEKVKTTNRPYVLYVSTDGNEKKDVRNSGFSLDYRHNLC